mgnify:CR=1 FL=1
MANDKISLNALIEEAEAAKLSLNAYLLPQSAAETGNYGGRTACQNGADAEVMEEAAATG